MAVVGAGVFGAWTAYRLQRSGKRVALIDAYSPGHSRSSSGDESRIIRMGYGADEIYTRSAQHSLALWKEFSLDLREPIFQQTGVLWLAHKDDPYPVNSLEVLTRFGISFDKLTNDEAHTRFPQIDLNEIAWALLEPESGVLFARRAVQAVVIEAVRSGVIFFREAVKPPTQKHPGFITTQSGRSISAGTYIFACGAWLPKIFPDLLADRIHPTRQEVFYFGHPSGDRFNSPALPVWIDFIEEAYGLPDLEGRGVKVAIDRHGDPFDPDCDNRIVSREGLDEVRAYLARRVPELRDAPVIETRVCQYENTSNGDFLIDRHPEFDNVWLVGGGSGHGFKHGPFVGEYVATRIEGNREGIERRFSLESKLAEHKRAVF